MPYWLVGSPTRITTNLSPPNFDSRARGRRRLAVHLRVEPDHRVPAGGSRGSVLGRTRRTPTTSAGRASCRCPAARHEAARVSVPFAEIDRLAVADAQHRPDSFPKRRRSDAQLRLPGAEAAPACGAASAIACNGPMTNAVRLTG